MRPESTMQVELPNRPKNSVVANSQVQHKRMPDSVGLRLVERYIKGELYVVVILRLSGESCKYAALLKWTRNQFGPLSEIAKGCDGLRAKPKRNEAPVLVDVVQLVQSPEAVSLSSVRIQPFNDLLSILPHSVHLSVVSGYLILGDRDVFGDRESGLTGRNAAICDDEFPRKVVESTVQILDNVSRNQGEVFGQRLGTHDISDVLSGIRILLRVDGVRVGGLELVKAGVEFLDVLVGPLDL